MDCQTGLWGNFSCERFSPQTVAAFSFNSRGFFLQPHETDTMKQSWNMLLALMVAFGAGWGMAHWGEKLVWAQGPKVKDPVFSHAMNLQVRLAEEKEFTPETIKYGIEVYRDAHTGNLIYISETGSISVVPAPL